MWSYTYVFRSPSPRGFDDMHCAPEVLGWFDAAVVGVGYSFLEGFVAVG